MASSVIEHGTTKKNKDELVGRAGRIIVYLEDEERDARKWQRKRETIKKFAARK